MKNNLLSAIAIVLTAIGLIGCAGMDSTNTKNLLSASGFSQRTPETAKQKELYAAAESYKVLHFSRDGKSVYAYKDEKSGTAFIGNERNYQEYQKLSVQQNIARQQYQAAEMQRDAAMGWYGAYGRYAYGPGFGRYGYYR